MNKYFVFHDCNTDAQNIAIEQRLAALSPTLFARWGEAKSVIFRELRARFAAAYPDAAADPALHALQCLKFMTRIFNQDHILSATELFLLLFATCMHDMGMATAEQPYVSTTKLAHYEVVRDIVMQQGWLNLSEQERQLVGYLCQWHNREHWYKYCTVKLGHEHCHGSIVRCGLLLSIMHICDSYHRLVDLEFFQ